MSGSETETSFSPSRDGHRSSPEFQPEGGPPEAFRVEQPAGLPRFHPRSLTTLKGLVRTLGKWFGELIGDSPDAWHQELKKEFKDGFREGVEQVGGRVT